MAVICWRSVGYEYLEPELDGIHLMASILDPLSKICHL